MTKSISRIKTTLTNQRPALAKAYGVKEICIFGSYVRGEQKTSSDLDILVDFDDAPGLLKFVHLRNYLTDLLGVNVDLVMKSALKPRIGKQILQEAMPI